ncbi:restriction endonuclease subunit S [Dokdonia sp. R78006]|uniref:restriction endonuclease subunit S n=1 Tax=Dokdonia sp. R78006 TaxID=3093866 RepID=UPI0036D39ADB
MNYKKIGDFIQQVNLKNEDGEVKNLLGVNLDKVFMPSVANLNGVDMTKYKIIKKGQFGCKLMSVGRDKKLPISHLTDYDKAIISSAYYVFEVKNEKELLPEYLMMWFLRSESDRFLWFLSGGDVRGRITWDDLCTLPIRIPSIEKQQQIVDEYNTVSNRIQLNEKINTNLEATAQALYKHWFVDFEFPYVTSSGVEMPYKSSGGKMVYNEELDKDIPVGFKIGDITNIAIIEDGDRGKNYPKDYEYNTKGYCLFLGAPNVSRTGFSFKETVFISKEKDNLLRKGKLKRNDIVFTTRGSSIGKLGFYSKSIVFEHLRINSGMVIFRCNSLSTSLYLYTILKGEYFQNLIQGYLSGSAQPQLPIKDLSKMPILIPNANIINEFGLKINFIQNNIELNNRISEKLNNFKSIILNKMARESLKPQAV